MDCIKILCKVFSKYGATELTVFHEKVHLQYWYNKMPKIHIVDEEKLVFEAIFKEWKKSKKWTDAEMIDSYNYVNKKVYDFNKSGKNFEYINYPEIEQLKINKSLGIK